MRTNYTAQGGYSTPPNKLKYDVTLHVCYFELSSFAKGAPKKKRISSIGKKGTPFRACWKNRKRRCINVGSRLVIYILAGWSADGINLVRENARVKLLYGDLNRLEGHLKKKGKTKRGRSRRYIHKCKICTISFINNLPGWFRLKRHTCGMHDLAVRQETKSITL